MSEFEAKYRKRNPLGGGDSALSSAPGGALELLREVAKDEYKAFNTSAHPETDLWVRVNDANGNSDVAIPYSYRNHMVYDGGGFLISMHFGTPVVSVTLHGRNLHDVWRKLLKREVEWVMEFDAEKWDTPAEGASCITRIEITRKPLPESYGNDTSSQAETADGKAAMH